MESDYMIFSWPNRPRKLLFVPPSLGRLPCPIGSAEIMWSVVTNCALSLTNKNFFGRPRASIPLERIKVSNFYMIIRQVSVSQRRRRGWGGGDGLLYRDNSGWLWKEWISPKPKLLSIIMIWSVCVVASNFLKKPLNSEQEIWQKGCPIPNLCTSKSDFRTL